MKLLSGGWRQISPEARRQIFIIVAGGVILGALTYISTFVIDLIRSKYNGKSKNYSCVSYFDDKLFWQGRIDNPLKYTKFNYTKSLSLPEDSATNISRLRVDAISNLLSKSDSELVKTSHAPYCANLASVFKSAIQSNDLIDQAIIAELQNRNYIYIDESVTELERTGCIYTLELSVFKEGEKTISNIIDQVQKELCIKKAIYEKYVQLLNFKDSISISLRDVVITLCDHCPNVKRVIEMRNQCPGGFENCQNLYFNQGKYVLSPVSLSILRNLYTQLSRNASYKIEFHGFTDAVPVKGEISYSGGAYKTTNGILMPGKQANSGNKILGITNNDELSFARAYSCYDYLLKNFGAATNSLFYTGHGESVEPSSEMQKRTVFITIKKLR